MPLLHVFDFVETDRICSMVSYTLSTTRMHVTVITWHWRGILYRRREFFFSVRWMICTFRKLGLRVWFPLSVSPDIPDIRNAKVRCAYNTELPFQTIVYYNVIYLNTPETAGVSHPVYWLFLYGLFMSHAHNPPPRASDSRPPFQSPGSVRMFCIARRSVVGFSYQWRWTSVVSVVCKKINRVAKILTEIYQNVATMR